MQPEIKDYQLYLFDLDDTLTRSISGEKFPQSVDDREFIEGRWERLLDLHEAGKKTAIVTNQGGAAWKIFSEVDMYKLLTRLCKSANIDKYFVCFHDTGEKARNSDRTIKDLTLPDRYLEWNRRKPGPGMLIQAMHEFYLPNLNHEDYRHEVIMVGDRPEDKAAAEAAGCDFAWAWDFFGDGPIMA